MNPLTLDNLKQLENIMSLMLSEAKDENWEKLTTLDGQRRAVLGFTTEDADGAGPPSSLLGMTQEYKERCEHIVLLDRQLMEAVDTARQALVEENRAIKNQVNAKKGYESTCAMKSVTYG